MSYATGLRAALLASSAIVAAYASPALAQSRDFDVPAGPAANGITAFAEQADIQILVVAADTRGRQTREVRGTMSAADGLQQLLAGTGLNIIANDGRTVTLSAQDPQGASAGGDVDALIVTAQKREENIQDVPIAISAFSQEALERSQIAGGPDLMTQIPNMTFTKTNFASYSIQIRGIGTQAISATTDAAVAVSFNNTSFIRNRFFEQEFYDLQRVEVLRGPQGTLYGRNATAGVVNVISAKPKFDFESKVSADVANYSSRRLEGMVNIPLVEDAVALRLAGAMIQREGYATNQITGAQIDGRDLWSTRVSLRVAPGDAPFDLNLIWEHFQEDDDRLRSGKQVCRRDDRTEIAGVPRPRTIGYSALYSQGCLPASMYAPESYQAPDGYSLPYYLPLLNLNVPVRSGFDPYRSTTQSRDLRMIESTVDPEYRAKSDLAELQINFDVSDGLTLTSETAYSTDSLFSMQDFNRFSTASGAFDQNYYDTGGGGIAGGGHLQNGVFCDPQIGCADRLVGIDLSTAKSKQFSQELRLSSDFDGPLNFSFGGNFLRYDTEDKYYVFVNTLGLFSAISRFGYQDGLLARPVYVPNGTDNHECMPTLPSAPDPNTYQPVSGCIYMDPNPIGSLNDKGHNYFLSRNPYKLISYATFGELYYNVTPDLKLTAGFRWTVDKKEAPRIPSWLLAGNTIGYPVAEVIEQEWREPTGRLAIDWKPDLAFTDETLLYASYAHGYKAGGANPPAAGVVTWSGGAEAQGVVDYSATQPKTFAPEFVDAFEIGAKNTLLDGRMTLNLGAFYYDYEGYQISYIVNRSAVNLNFDAEVWGLELEADWRPVDNLRLGFKGGYEKTRVADGARAIDTMDRTAGNPDWIVVRPFPTYPSNCILPLNTAVNSVDNFLTKNPDAYQTGFPGPCEIAYSQGLDPLTRLPYVADPTVWYAGVGVAPLPAKWSDYPGFDPLTAPNHGEGFFKELGGKELPNAPHFTATVTADYTMPLRGDWQLTLHTDLYYQSEAWTRIFNTEGYDKLKAYTNINFAAIFANEEAGWKVMAYVKNVMDRDSITGAFLISDDTGLPTNVFLTEPRLYGVRVTKDFAGGALLGSFGARRSGPYPLTVELGGQVQRHDATNAAASPGFINQFPSTLDSQADMDPALDWGDGREVKLTYAPSGNWQVSLAARFGKTNGSDSAFRSQLGDAGCNGFFYVAPNYCDDPSHTFSEYNRSTNWSQADHVQKEEHTIVDFALGYDIGIGLLGEEGTSEVSLALRYAQLKSSEDISLYGIPDWNLPSGVFPQNTAHRYRLTANADRGFEGGGPVIAWDASRTLVGNEGIGHADLDWSVSGGVLFGKQSTSIAGREEREDISVVTYGAGTGVIPKILTPVAIDRSDSITVPTVAASLGVSYKVDRVMIGAGYRWERYFDSIDGGYGASSGQGRTIDGPYLKLSVGFGG